MIDVGKAITFWRKRRSMTQQDLATALGCTKQTVSNYERNNRRPDYEVLEAISDIFNVPISVFITDADRLQELNRRYATYEKGKIKSGPAPANLPHFDTNTIPVLTLNRIPVMGSIKAGPGGVAAEEIIDYVDAANLKNPNDYFYLKVTGDSMEPKISEGDLALIHRQPTVDSGELAAVIVNGDEGTLKRVLVSGDTIILESFNPYYPPRIFRGEEINTLMICGKVVKTERRW